MNIEKLREIYKLKHIVRYNTRRHLKDESVAEHSFYVALISLLLCKENNLDDKTTMDAVIKALLHDMPEMELNDITHDTKEKLNLRPLLKVYEDAYYQEHFPDYAKLMISNTGVASTIVDIADAMSVLQYADNEQIIGNTDEVMTEIIEDANTRILQNGYKLADQMKRREYERKRSKKKDK